MTSPSPASPPGLKRGLGLGLLTLYGIGVMVGAGIYVLVGAVAGAAGTYAPLAFLLAGLIAAPTAATYAELSSRIPESGGEAAYLREAFGIRWLGRLAGLAIIGGATISGAAVLQGGVGYLQHLVPLPDVALIVGLGLLLALAAIAGVVESLALAAFLTLVEAGGLLAVIAAGALAPAIGDPVAALDAAFAGWLADAFAAHAAGGGAAAPLAQGGLAGIGAGALLAFFAFIGFEDMVNMAEETKDPERTMPRAILLALGVVTLLYAGVSWAALRAVEASALAASDRPLALVMEAGLPQGTGALALIAFAAALNGVLAQMVMCARMLFGLGRDGRLFAVFHHAHPRFGTPVLATAAAAAVMIGVALGVPLLQLAATSATILLFAFCAVNFALIRLKRRDPRPAGAFVTPMWVPYMGLVTAVAALAMGWI
ncbi:APC family permease [Rhodovulum sp. DZ06]|uniref:APC family permease n=1 Tax=Rhodovulum sp. DZ06 TaxID=3425126 RepID=UPI003D34B213